MSSFTIFNQNVPPSTGSRQVNERSFFISTNQNSQRNQTNLSVPELISLPYREVSDLSTTIEAVPFSFVELNERNRNKLISASTVTRKNFLTGNSFILPSQKLLTTKTERKKRRKTVVKHDLKSSCPNFPSYCNYLQHNV